MLDRRLFLGGSMAAFGLSACGANTAKVAGGNMIKEVGLQTYTLREIFEPDPVGTLAMLKDIGYDYVELNGRNFSERDPKDLAMMIKDAGMYAPATHVSFEEAVNTPEAVADVCQTLGCKYAIIPWTDENRRSKEEWYEHAASFEAAGKIMNDNGVRLAYHNHQFEFDDLGGETAMDILLSNTSAENVDFEIDLFWAALGQADLAALFKAHPRRFKLCHIKDMKGDPAQYRMSRDYGKIGKEIMVDVGKGDLPFEEYFAMNDISGLEYFVAEHDNPTKPYRDAVETSYNSIKAMRF